MEELLDIVWFKIVDVIEYIRVLIDFGLTPLHPLGPIFIIFILAVVTVAITKALGKAYQPKRYLALEKEFRHWHGVRAEAMACSDFDKGKALAKNIDQGKLNRVYYDYFFEGLLRSLITRYVPVLIVAAYVNEAFKTANLLALFGRDHLFQFVRSQGDAVKIGSVFWYVVVLVAVYLGWSLVLRLWRKYRINPSAGTNEAPSAPISACS
jgi:hypothetical protein